MTAPYIPPKSAALDAWATNFSTLITAAPATYGLTPADATAISAAVSAFHAAYLLGGVLADGHTPVNPSTRTPVTVGAMRSQQAAMVPTLRTYASQIRLDPGVANSDKLALGLTLPNTTPSPVPAPASWPLLTLLNSAHLLQQFSYKDSLTPTGKAKAAGAIALLLVGTADITPPASPDILPPIGNFTKSPFQITWPSPASGKTAYLYTRWVTRKGLFGPWSPLTSALIP